MDELSSFLLHSLTLDRVGVKKALERLYKPERPSSFAAVDEYRRKVRRCGCTRRRHRWPTSSRFHVASRRCRFETRAPRFGSPISCISIVIWMMRNLLLLHRRHRRHRRPAAVASISSRRWPYSLNSFGAFCCFRCRLPIQDWIGDLACTLFAA